jgi:tRNA (Thr-GGU) A37 N-methylase
VQLIAVNGCELVIEEVNVVDGTPLLDIKPYVPVRFRMRSTGGSPAAGKKLQL